MQEYTVSFAGLHITVQYDTDEVYHFLSFLFNDIHGVPVGDHEICLHIAKGEKPGEYALSNTASTLCSGPLGVHFSAVLFDAILFNLLNKNNHGIAFHAGAVAYQGKVILLPGLSGSGKSCITAYLTAHGSSYLTDELYFMPADENSPMLPFTRPLCIKPTAATAVITLIDAHGLLHETINDSQGLVIPHRLLNPEFSTTCHPPVLILFPRYQAGAPLTIDKISGARACTQLMTCDVNARNLKDHGFQQVAQFARSTPAYQITYSSFDGIDNALQDLFNALRWT